MISANYVVNLYRSHWILLGTSFAFVGLFQMLVMLLVASFDMPAMMQGIAEQMPAPMQAIFGEQFITQFSVGSGVGFGYSHPFVVVTLSLVAILLPARHVAGEIEGGTFEVLLAMPIRRSAVAFSLWLASGAAVFALILGCWAGTGMGLLLFPETRGLDVSSVGRLGINLWLLFAAVTSYTLLISAFAREGGKAALRAAGLTLLFYFLDLAAQFWPTVDFLAPFTLFHYFQPQELMRGAPVWGRNVAILSVIALTAGILGILRVRRRDIP